MRVDVSEELQRFVESKVRSGDYTSADEVVADALSRWKAEEEIDPAELVRLVAEGRAEADRGELEDAENTFARIREESARRRQSGK